MTTVRAVVFDIDGTLLDSAPGIVAGIQHALRLANLSPGDAAAIRSDLGPPVGLHLTALGIPADRLADAVEAYRSFYRAEGMYDAVPYAGIAEVLKAMTGSVTLGTATAKRTDTAQAILAVHGLAQPFAVINGTDDLRTTKAETIAHTLEQLGHPDPVSVLMVGDRHSDITGGQACGVRTVGVTWGYGSADELRTAGADHLISRPEDLLDLLD